MCKPPQKARFTDAQLVAIKLRDGFAACVAMPQFISRVVCDDRGVSALVALAGEPPVSRRVEPPPHGCDRCGINAVDRIERLFHLNTADGTFCPTTASGPTP